MIGVFSGYGFNRSRYFFKSRVSQVALMATETCRLSYPGEDVGSHFPTYQAVVADFAHKIEARPSHL